VVTEFHQQFSEYYEVHSAHVAVTATQVVPHVVVYADIHMVLHWLVYANVHVLFRSLVYENFHMVVRSLDLVVHDVLVHDVPVHDVPVHDVPVHYVLVHDVLVHDVPVHDVPVHDVPVHYVLVHDVPVHYVLVHSNQKKETDVFDEKLPFVAFVAFETICSVLQLLAVSLHGYLLVAFLFHFLLR
jgi:hypothetical protein